MNWIDIVLLAAVVACAVRGMRRGGRAAGPEMASFLLAFFVALVGYRLVSWIFAAVIGEGLIAHSLGLLVVWLGAQWGILTLLRKLFPLPEREKTPPWEPAGGILGALEGLVFSALFLTLCVVFPNERLPKQAVMDSGLGRPLVEIAFGFESRLAEWLGGPFRTSLTFRTLTPGSGDRIPLHFRSTRVEVSPEDEQRMLDLVNEERRARNLPLLRMDEHLQEAARAHSRDMLARGYIGHVSPDGTGPGERIAAAGAHADSWAENVAVAPTVSIAHAGLMSSPGHRKNILNPAYARVGIGAVRSRVFGTAFAQEFGD